MYARCLVQTQILLLPINVSCYYYPSSLAQMSPCHDLSSTQLLTLDYYTRSTPQLYPVSASSSWPVNEITNFLRRHCFSIYVTGHRSEHTMGIQNT